MMFRRVLGVSPANGGEGRRAKKKSSHLAYTLGKAIRFIAA